MESKGITRSMIWLLAACIIILTSAGQSHAGVLVAAGPDYPSTAFVGNVLNRTFSIVNNSTGDEGAGNLVAPVFIGEPGLGVLYIPSCGFSSPSGFCNSPGEDPGVFSVASPAFGKEGTACEGKIFDVVLDDPVNGQLKFVPQDNQDIILGPTGTANAICTIDIVLTVQQIPSKDSKRPPVFQAGLLDTTGHGKVTACYSEITQDTADATGSDSTSFPICGDGTTGNTPGETCDPPTGLCGFTKELCTSNADCNSTFGEVCGGLTDAGDLGVAGRVCRDSGTIYQCTFCGDGIVNGPPDAEECDDGNSVNGDGCNNNCQPETCSVLVDKAVNCGEGAVDQTLVSANEDGTNGCSTLNGSPVTTTYRVNNPSVSSNLTLVNCVLTDTANGGGVIRQINVGTVSVGQTITLDPINELCSDARELLEPDTATVVCDCGQAGSGLGQVTAFDTATFVCNDCDTTTRTVSSQTGGVTPGTSVFDTATVTTSCEGLTPTGTVDFYLCGPIAGESRPAGCNGGSFVSTDTLTVPDGGVATSATVSKTDLGWYCWRAVYTPAGEPFNGSSETLDGVNECFRVICEPSCSVRKTATPTLTKPNGQYNGWNSGDIITYTVDQLCNTGTCPLQVNTCSDQKNNGTGPYNCAGLWSMPFTLQPGECVDDTSALDSISYQYTALSTDPNPLTNIVTIGCSSAAGPLTCQDDASVNIVNPSFTVNKSCSPHTQPPVIDGQTGTPITWEIVLANTGDVALNICCTDTTADISNECRNVGAGQSSTITPTSSYPTSCPATGELCITNTVSCTATATGLDNTIIPTADGSQTSDECCYSCETPQVSACRMTGGMNNPLDVVSSFEGNGKSYTQGGQIGAPSARGCCDYPQKGKCVAGFCTGGSKGGSACTTDEGCPNNTGSNATCPWGNWEHNHHGGPDDTWEAATGSEDLGIADGKFAFHSGTPAAPDSAFIHNIICEDEGYCVQARPAPVKQIFWEGTGVFHNVNIKGKAVAMPDFLACQDSKQPKPWSNKTEGTLHYYRAHVGDFGEYLNKFDFDCDWENTCGTDPLKGGVSIWDCELKDDFCPMTPVRTDAKQNHPLCLAQDCGCNLEDSEAECTKKLTEKGCADWYEIEIHCGLTTADLAGKTPAEVLDVLQEQPIAYKVAHHITGGNFQLHPTVGDSCNFQCDGQCESGYFDSQEQCNPMSCTKGDCC